MQMCHNSMMIEIKQNHKRAEDSLRYRAWSLSELDAALKIGHTNKAGLDQLLILTTNSITTSAVHEYFGQLFNDEILLKDLIKVTSEGEYNGDRPWAAAHLIVKFEKSLLVKVKPDLERLSRMDYGPVAMPARTALQKIAEL
jgi:hypothetical protein